MQPEVPEHPSSASSGADVLAIRVPKAARRRRITCVVGTRPEAIKMAPVIQRLKQEDWCDVTVLCTAQHRELLDQVLQFFRIMPDADFGVMRPNQTLAGLTSRLIRGFDKLLSHSRPD